LYLNIHGTEIYWIILQIIITIQKEQ
jgi:hypothetical protein